ncbi:MAG: hypothetical protein E7585_03195 [Ruminococcaceae bacterium]|nr:hypothetical protein [Oscillospiraceae bacterium]
MKILKIEVNSFGRLRELMIEPGDGMTLIEGENESGKSTLLAFFRFIFYGFPRKGGRDGEERDKRVSWQNRTAAGRLTLERDGVRYCVSRHCYLRGSAGRETFSEELSVIALPDGEEISLGAKSPGEFFLGLPAELYDGSLSLVQSGADRVCRPDMGEAVGDLLFHDDAVFSAETAESKLQAARRELQYAKGRGGKIADLEDRLLEIDRALSEAAETQNRLERLRAAIQQCRSSIAEKRRELAEIGAAFEAIELNRTVALLEDLERARAVEMACAAQLEKVEAQAAAELPDADCLQRMADALRGAITAGEKVERLMPELARLDGIRHEEKLLSGAGKLAEAGGAEAWLQKVKKQNKKRNGRLLTGSVLTTIGLGVGAVGFWHAAWRPYAFGGAALFLLIGIAFLLTGVLAGVRKAQLLSAVGATHVPLLRTYVLQCEREAEAYRAHAERRQGLSVEYEAAKRQQTEAEALLRAEFEGLGKAALYRDPQSVADFLAQLTQRKDALQAALAKATIAYERARGVVEALSKRLAGVDETALRARKQTLPQITEDLDTLSQRRGFLEKELLDLEQRTAETERAEAALAAVAREPSPLERERVAVVKALEGARRRLAAIRMALDGLKSAAEDLRKELTPKLGVQTAKIFDQLTEGAHGELRLGNDFSMTLEGEGMPRPLSYFSAGCRDAACLSLRLALLSTVSKERLPLFFDEAFSRLDDRRTCQLLQVLRQYCLEGGQCLLFTCHGREAAFLSSDAGVKRFALKK